MALNTLKDVYLDQLQDLYSATKQSQAVTAELGEAANSAALSKALIDGSNGIARGMDALASLCSDHGLDMADVHCHAMEGMVREAREHALQPNFGDPAARDAMVISQYQRMVHYAVAGYGCLVAFANRLGLDGDADVLQRCLDETHGGNDRMTRIARDEVHPVTV